MSRYHLTKTVLNRLVVFLLTVLLLYQNAAWALPVNFRQNDTLAVNSPFDEHPQNNDVVFQMLDAMRRNTRALRAPAVTVDEIKQWPSEQISAEQTFQMAGISRPERLNAARIVDRIGLKTGDRILDIGPENLVGTAIAAVLKGAIVDVAHLEQHQNLCDLTGHKRFFEQGYISTVLKNKLQIELPLPNYHAGKVQDMPLKNGSYKAVFLFNVLDFPDVTHEERERLFLRVLSLLEDGGHLFISFFTPGIVRHLADNDMQGLVELARREGYILEMCGKNIPTESDPDERNPISPCMHFVKTKIDSTRTAEDNPVDVAGKTAGNLVTAPVENRLREIAEKTREFIEQNKQRFWEKGLRITTCLGHAIEVQRRFEREGITSKIFYFIRSGIYHVWVRTDSGWIVDAYTVEPEGGILIERTDLIAENNVYEGNDVFCLEDRDAMRMRRDRIRWIEEAERIEAEQTEFKYIESLLSVIRAQAVASRDLDEELVLAIDTDIGNLSVYAQELFSALEKFREALARQGLFNVRIFTGSGEQLERRIKEYIDSKGENDKFRISALARKQAIDEDARFRGIRDKIHITAVDDNAVDNRDEDRLGYIPILAILEVAIKNAIGVSVEDIKNEYGQIEDIGSIIAQDGMLIIKLLPKPQPIPVEQLRERYENEALALSRSA